MKIATSRYHAAREIRESGLAPVGITVGAAKYLRYELAGNVGLLAPYGLIRPELPPATFTRRYRKQLDTLGVDTIRAVLWDLAVGWYRLNAMPLFAATDGVVLLCFENVHDGEFCHRSVFARWWQQRTGEKVHELEPAQGRLT